MMARDLDGVVKDFRIWSLGPIDKTVWAFVPGTHDVVVVKTGPAAAVKDGFFVVEYSPPELPPEPPRAAVERAQSIVRAAWDYDRATDPYLMRVNPLPSPHVAVAPTPAEFQAAEMILEMHHTHTDALRDLAELQSKRQAMGEKTFLELLRKDHPPCGDE